MTIVSRTCGVVVCTLSLHAEGPGWSPGRWCILISSGSAILHLVVDIDLNKGEITHLVVDMDLE